jgi:hypothetical protein
LRNPDAHTNSYSNSHSDSDSNGYSHSYSHGHANGHGHGYSYSDSAASVADANTHAQTYADAQAAADASSAGAALSGPLIGGDSRDSAREFPRLRRKGGAWVPLVPRQTRQPPARATLIRHSLAQKRIPQFKNRKMTLTDGGRFT